MLDELRIYTLHPGKLEAMKERFTRVNRVLFARHGIEVVNIWRNPDDENTFVFLLTFPDRETRERAWAAYHEDPDFLAQRDEQKSIIANITLHLLAPLQV